MSAESYGIGNITERINVKKGQSLTLSSQKFRQVGVVPFVVGLYLG